MAKSRTNKPKPLPTPSTIEQDLHAGVAATISEILAKHARPAPQLTIAPAQLTLPRALVLDVVEADIQADKAQQDDAEDAWKPLDILERILLQLGDLLRSPELHDLARSVAGIADLIYKRACSDTPMLDIDDLNLLDVEDEITRCPKGDLPWTALRRFLTALDDKCDSRACEVLEQLRGVLITAETEFSQKSDTSTLTLEERVVWHMWATNGGKPVSVAMIAINRGIPRTDVNVEALIDSNFLDQVELTMTTKGGQSMVVPHYQPTQAWVLAVARHEEQLPAKPPDVSTKGRRK
jgi:hypothetical protein